MPRKYIPFTTYIPKEQAEALRLKSKETRFTQADLLRLGIENVLKMSQEELEAEYKIFRGD